MLFNLLLFCFSRQEKYSLLSNKLPFTKFCIQPALSEENLDKKHLCLLHLQNLFREQVSQPLPAPLRTLTCRKRENDQDSCPQQKFGWSHIFTHNYKDLFKILLQSMLYTLQLQNGLTVLSQVKPIKSSIFSSAKKAKKNIHRQEFLFPFCCTTESYGRKGHAETTESNLPAKAGSQQQVTIPVDSTILYNTYCQDFIKKRNCSFIILLPVCRQCLWIQALKLIRFRQLSLGFFLLIIAGIGFELKMLTWRETELLAQKTLCPINNHNM